MRNGFRALVIISLLLFSSAALALGLGKPSVKSFLNQPLEVEIELLAISPAETESVTARLATLRDYQRVGLGQLRLSVPLNFTVFATSNRAFILIESTEPVRDPVIQLLLDVSWSRGRLLKEYTLFLDPPTVAIAPPRIIRRPPPQTIRQPEPEVTAAPETVQPEPFLEVDPDPVMADADEPERDAADDETVSAEAFQVAEPEPTVAETPPAADTGGIVADEAPEVDRTDEPAITENQDFQTAETAATEVVTSSAAESVSPEIGGDEIAADDASVDDEPADQPVAQEPIAPEPEPVILEIGGDDIAADDAAVDDEPAEQPAAQEPIEVEPVSPEIGADEITVDDASVDVEPADQPVAQAPIAPEPEPVAPEPRVLEPIIRAVSASVDYGPVERGDTLWRIARDWVDGSEFSINQAMITIALANPRAFGNGNINRLRAGAVLRMPEDWEIARLNRTEANRSVVHHIDAWRNNSRSPLPVPVLSDAGSDFPEPEPTSGVPQGIASAEPESDSEKPDSEPSAPEPPEPDLSKPRLELLATELNNDGPAGGATATELEQRAQLQLVQQLLKQAEAKMRTNPEDWAELNVEIQDLRASILELSRAMNLDDKDLAALAARSRNSRIAERDGSSQSLDDLLAEARGAVDQPGSAAMVADDRTEQAPRWWEREWFIFVIGLLLLVGFVTLLRRGASSGAGKYGDKSLIDSLIEEEEAHVDYSAVAVPSVEPEDTSNDMSTLTEETERTVTVEGTTVSEVDMDEDELAQFLSEHRTSRAAGKDAEAEGDIESKLDLAIAYVGSGENAKARKLLEEIRRSGDKRQQATARKLLGKL